MTWRCSPFFFFNDTATTEIYTLSLHDALPISYDSALLDPVLAIASHLRLTDGRLELDLRSEEHTSELQSRLHLVCRLLLEKKKNSASFSPRMTIESSHVSDCASSDCCSSHLCA